MIGFWLRRETKTTHSQWERVAFLIHLANWPFNANSYTTYHNDVPFFVLLYAYEKHSVSVVRTNLWFLYWTEIIIFEASISMGAVPRKCLNVGPHIKCACLLYIISVTRLSILSTTWTFTVILIPMGFMRTYCYLVFVCKIVVHICIAVSCRAWRKRYKSGCRILCNVVINSWHQITWAEDRTLFTTEIVVHSRKVDTHAGVFIRSTNATVLADQRLRSVLIDVDVFVSSENKLICVWALQHVANLLCTVSIPWSITTTILFQ